MHRPTSADGKRATAIRIPLGSSRRVPYTFGIVFSANDRGMGQAALP
jgi:hypothetical protein